MNMTTVIVLAPDLGSGYDFYEDLLANSTLPSHQIHFFKIDILARVVNDKLTTQILEINDQLLQVFKSLVASFTPSNKVIVTIACNTLSLPRFLQSSMEFLRNYPHIHLLTTLEAVQAVISTPKELFVGTKPLSYELNHVYPQIYTPINSPVFNSNEERLAMVDLVQEIIWRVKAQQHSLVDTAPQYQPDLQSEENLKELKLKTDLLLGKLSEKGVNDLILGCTELPSAFKILAMEKQIHLNLINPVHLIAKEIADY